MTGHAMKLQANEAGCRQNDGPYAPSPVVTNYKRFSHICQNVLPPSLVLSWWHNLFMVCQCCRHSQQIISYHSASYQNIPSASVSHHIISNQTTCFNIIIYTISYLITSQHLTSYNILSYHIKAYHIIL